MSAEVRDQNARVMAGATVTWTSSASSIATVDASGLVTAAGNGTATITASAGPASGSAVVTVMQSVALVEVSPSVYELTALGQTVQLTAEAFDENGHAVAEAEFSWESSDAAVATVDAGGLVTAVGDGQATITASAGAASGSAVVTVRQLVNLDRAALVALYEATGGPNWVNSDNWLTDAPLGEWHGVSVDGQGRVTWLFLSENGLIGPVPPELGNLANLQQLYLWQNSLTGPIPPELGNLANLLWLLLNNNNLTGPVPPELGNLANLKVLRLWDNALTGPIPASFLQLHQLDQIAFSDNQGLCAPGTTGFVVWLQGIDQLFEGPFCNASDVAVLEALYEAAGGADWTESGGWLEGVVLSEWYGVSANALGQVTGLGLSRNGLAGRLPPSMGELAKMTALRVGGNALSRPVAAVPVSSPAAGAPLCGHGAVRTGRRVLPRMAQLYPVPRGYGSGMRTALGPRHPRRAIQCDRRTGLDEPQQLAYRCAAGGLVRH